MQRIGKVDRATKVDLSTKTFAPSVMSKDDRYMLELKRHIALKHLVMQAKSSRELMACLLILESLIDDDSLTHWWVESYRPFSVRGSMRKATAKAIAAAAAAAEKAVAADKDAAAAAAARAHKLHKKFEGGIDAAAALLAAPTTALIASRAMALKTALAQAHARTASMARHGSTEVATAARRRVLLQQSRIVDKYMTRMEHVEAKTSGQHDESSGEPGGEGEALGAVAAKSRVNMGLPPLEILLLDRAGPITQDLTWTFGRAVELGKSANAAEFLEGVAFAEEQDV